ncbi:peptidoglycan editing factor PgeF [Sulfurimonas sp.]|uniref:peptidoglycan editing factor PgeF n=1 Tax=Sulfurimonas sp. TaxID=2022749 RepID=UPI00262A161B|nr:peptidoglycan editing factor PgeF [Sulfurimonas sp.]
MKFYQSLILNFSTKQNANLAFHVQDDPSTVIQNHQRLAKELGYEYKNLVHMKQIHSNIVKIVDQNDNFTNPPTCDGLITNKKETPLMVMVADCSPILFYDDVKNIIAVAHAGRAGAFGNIVQNVIKSFINDFDSDPKNIKVEVGPAICQKCYEVGVEIVKEAHSLRLEYAVLQKKERYYLDIRAILKKQLLHESVLDNNIKISNICNCCDDNYYSYREDKKCGRFAGIISL